MKIRATVSLFALSLTLAACGGGAEEADDPVAPAAEETAAPVAEPAEPGDADETGATDATEDTDETAEPQASESAAPEAPSGSSASAATPAESTASAAPAKKAPAAAAPRPPMFAVCAACHSVEPGKNGIGPSLAGVFGAKSGHVSSFRYSPAMEGADLTWDAATLDRYLENPQQTVPGTTMAFNGVANDAQRQAIIDYLKGL